MVKILAIAFVATVMGFGMTNVASAGSAKDPSAGQSSSELGSLSPQSGSPSESGKTGIGSTSGSDASVGTGLKATSQDKNAPCPEHSAAAGAEHNKAMADAKDASKSKSSAEMSARMGADPCVDASSAPKERR